MLPVWSRTTFGEPLRPSGTARRGPVKTGKRGLARVTGGEGAARYACRLLRAAFNWAVDERLIDRNPADGVDLGHDGEREAVLDADGYARLFSTLATMEGERRLRSSVADAVRIIAMTGARRGGLPPCAGGTLISRPAALFYRLADTRPAARPVSLGSFTYRQQRNRLSPDSQTVDRMILCSDRSRVPDRWRWQSRGGRFAPRPVYRKTSACMGCGIRWHRCWPSVVRKRRRS